MPWIIAGGALLGGIGGAAIGGEDKDPWDPHDFVPNHLRDEWEDYGNAIGALQDPQYYQGQLIADQNPWLANSLSGMGEFGSTGVGAGAMGNSVLGGIGALQTGLGDGLDYMNDLSQRQGGLFQYDQGVFDQTMGNLMPAMQGSFDAATRDINRDLNWNTLPGINMAGVAAGHQGSTKVGQQSALAEGMAQDRASDIGASLYQNAVNQAQGAAMDAGQANLRGDFDLLGRYGEFGRLGGQLLGQGYDMGVGNLDMMNQAGAQQFGYDQSLINADKAKFDWEQTAPWDFLNQRLSMINGQKVGGVNPAPIGGANPWLAGAQGAQMGLGLADMFGSMGQNYQPGWQNGGVSGDVWGGGDNSDFSAWDWEDGGGTYF